MTPRIWGQCFRQGRVPRRENTRRPTLPYLHVMMTPLMITEMIEMMDPNLALPDSWKKGKSLKECNEFQAAMVGDCFVNSFFRPGSIVQYLRRFTDRTETNIITFNSTLNALGSGLCWQRAIACLTLGLEPAAWDTNF